MSEPRRSHRLRAVASLATALGIAAWPLSSHAEPFDITDPTPRFVSIDIEANLDPLRIGERFNPGHLPLGLWSSDGETGQIILPGPALEEVFFGWDSVSDWVTFVEIETGHVLASRFEGDFRGPEDLPPPVGGSQQVRYFATTLPGRWSDSGLDIPGQSGGVNPVSLPPQISVDTLYVFCTDEWPESGPFGPACGSNGVLIPGSSYDAETGLLNAPGLYDIFPFATYAPIGDWRLSEVEVELAGPFDIADARPRMIALEIETSDDPDVVGSDPAAQFDAVQYAHWTSDGETGTIQWTGEVADAEEPDPDDFAVSFGLEGEPIPEPQPPTGTVSIGSGHVDWDSGHIDERFDGAWMLTTRGVFSSLGVGTFEGGVAGWEGWPTGPAEKGEEPELEWRFCTDALSTLSPGQEECHDGGYGTGYLSALPYDPFSGRVVATGPRIDGDKVLLDLWGDQRWREVDITWTVPEPGPIAASATALLLLAGLRRRRPTG